MRAVEVTEFSVQKEKCLNKITARVLMDGCCLIAIITLKPKSRDLKLRLNQCFPAQLPVVSIKLAAQGPRGTPILAILCWDL